MGTTPNLNLPYPELSDTPDVPRDIKALALALDGVSARSMVVRLAADTGVSGRETWQKANLSVVADAWGVSEHLAAENGGITVMKKGLCILTADLTMTPVAAVRIAVAGQPLSYGYLPAPLGAAAVTTMRVVPAGALVTMELYAYPGSGAITVAGGDGKTRLGVIWLHGVT